MIKCLLVLNQKANFSCVSLVLGFHIIYLKQINRLFPAKLSNFRTKSQNISYYECLCGINTYELLFRRSYYSFTFRRLGYNVWVDLVLHISSFVSCLELKPIIIHISDSTQHIHIDNTRNAQQTYQWNEYVNK